MSTVPIVEEPVVVATRAPRHFARRLLRRPLAAACVAWLLLLVGVAILAPLLMPDVAAQRTGNLLDIYQGPSAEHWAGTDSLGRDVLDRLMIGTRPTLYGVAQAILVVIALGVPLGLLAGYFGGWIDRVISWFGDLIFALPAVVLVIVVLSVFPQSLTAGMVGLGVLASPGLMRVVRAATLPVAAELYIAAARVSGLSRTYIVVRHVLPRIMGSIIVQVALLSATALIVQTGLAFLGLVSTPPAPSWGGMINDGASALFIQPWLIWPPGIAIAMTILALGLLGDAIRDVTAETWSPPVARLRRHQRPGPTSGPDDDPYDERALLDIRGLTVSVPSPDGDRLVLQDVTFDIRPGETVGVVGESGCGKTTSALAALGLLPGAAEVENGRISFLGRDLLTMSESDMEQVRGREIGFISQEPMVSLNPAFTIGWQLAEAVRTHRGGSRGDARRRAVELLRLVHLPDPEAIAGRYPHEISGGMAQRVVIARALAGEPKLLIADEPTTALDVTIQVEILDLLREIQQETQMSILMVTHDLGVVADSCDRVVVMYAGHVVERADVHTIFAEPRHAYTQALMASNPHNLGQVDVLPTIAGTVPSPGAWPKGCHFQPRCPLATTECAVNGIPMVRLGPDRETRCIHHDALTASKDRSRTP